MTWIIRSFYAMPFLWIAGALFWLVPLLSPHAPGHHLYVVPLLIWPFLLLLALGSLYLLMLARTNQIDLLGHARKATLGSLQVLLLAIFVIGSIPILTFDVAPERSIAATAIETPFGLIAATGIVIQGLLLHHWRSTSS